MAVLNDDCGPWPLHESSLGRSHQYRWLRVFERESAHTKKPARKPTGRLVSKLCPRLCPNGWLPSTNTVTYGEIRRNTSRGSSR